MRSALVLLLAMGSGTWLDVPFTKQSKDGCGSASIWMVMQYWRSGSSPSVEDIQHAVYSPRAGGVYARDMESYFAAHGFHTYAFNGHWTDLSEHLASGRPLIICLESNARGTPLHYVVVAGVDADQDTVLINDPADRKLRMIRRSELEKRWAATGNWALLAVPEGNSPLRPSVPATPETAAPIHDDQIRSALESATSAFRRQAYGEAKRYASRAERRDPQDPTTNELLATLFFIDGNHEAALKHWNRVGKPMLHEVNIEPRPRLDAIRLDHAFDFSSASLLTADSYLRTTRMLDRTGAFSNYSFELDPAAAGTFDLTFRNLDRSGAHYLSWLRGLPFQTIQPEFTDIGGKAINVNSIFRFDRWKRRALVSLSAPAGPGAASRLRITGDARDEEWQISGERLLLHRAEIVGEFHSVAGPRTEWSSGFVLGSRNEWGTSLKYTGSANHDFVRWPERRLTMTGAARVQVGRWFSKGRFVKAEPSLLLDWLPRATGSDLHTSLRFNAGAVSADIPFDELFSLGLDRDTDLSLRAHPATHDGRKGSAVLGRRYGLLNAQIEKAVHDFGLVHFSVVPFVDTARVSRWYTDAGLEFRFSMASIFKLSLSVGRDLRTGRTVAFASTTR